MKNARKILTVCLIILIGITLYAHDFYDWLYQRLADENSNIYAGFPLLELAEKKISTSLSLGIAIPLAIIDFLFVFLPAMSGCILTVVLYLIINFVILISKISGSGSEFVGFYAIIGFVATGVILIWWAFILWLAGYYVISPAVCYVVSSTWKSVMMPAIAYMVRKRWIKMKSKKERQREEAEREYQEKNKGYEDQIEENERQVVAIYRQYPDVATVPEVLRHLSEDLRYKGFFGEIARRFEDEQVMKTTVTRTAAINKVIQLVQVIGQLRKAQADLYRTFYEAAASELETNIMIKNMQEGAIEEQVNIKLDIAKLTLLEQKSQLRANITQNKSNISNLKTNYTKETKGPTPADREIQSTKDKIELLKARGANIAMAAEARDMELNGLGLGKDDPTYQTIRRMWDRFIMELMEK